MNDETYRPLLRSQSDVEAAWRQLMGPGGYGRHSLWLMVILPDDRPFPHLLEIDGTTSPPEEEELAALAALLRTLVGEMGDGSRVAFLLSRPGGPGLVEGDRAWAHATYAASRRAGVAFELTHLATEDGVRPIPPDELCERESA